MDGLGFQPRAQTPESAMLPGMAAPQSMPDTSIAAPVQLQEPATWVYDFDPATGSSRATYNGEVGFTSGGSGTAGVTTFNGRAGTVTLQAADLTGLNALVNPSPALLGVPTAPTPSPGDSSTTIATTAFVAQAIVANPIVQSFNGRTGAVSLTTGDLTGAGGAPAASPALTGVPTAPTASQGNASSQVATTQFVSNALASGAVTSFNGRQGSVTFSLSDGQSVGLAPISSPSFTGQPLCPTATPGTATTQIASTAFVTNAVSAATAGVSSFNTRTGAVTLQLADVTSVGGAPILSPAMTGTPSAPTPTAGDSSTKLATTAFVGTAIASLPSGVTTFNGRSGTVTMQLADVTSVGGAPLASPVLTGAPKSVTPAAADNSTNIATTAFVLANALSIVGVTNGVVAPTGQVGEIIRANVSATALTSAVNLSLGSITVTPGDWDIWAEINFTGSTNNMSQVIGQTTVAGGYATIGASGMLLGSYQCAIPTRTMNTSTSQTVVLQAYAVFSTGTATASGSVTARRVR